MKFEGRSLRPYAESITKDLLRKNSVYYTVSFFDDEMTIPQVTTLIFIGEAEQAQTRSPEYVLKFQLAEAYYTSENRDFILLTAAELAGVYEFDEALNVLLRCSIRRTGK